MFDMKDIHPLTGFLRNHKAHLERLQSTGKPEILTVNGRARVVVQDASAYQEMMAVIDAVEAEQIIRKRLKSVEQGDPGVPASDVLRDIRETLGIDNANAR